MRVVFASRGREFSSGGYSSSGLFTQPRGGKYRRKGWGMGIFVFGGYLRLSLSDTALCWAFCGGTPHPGKKQARENMAEGFTAMG